MPKKDAARAAMLEYLSARGLGGQQASTLKLQPYTAEQLVKHKDLPQMGTGGFKIPYFDIAGKPLNFFRFRYLYQYTGFAKLVGGKGKKELRYAQPTGSTTRLYFPPQLDWKLAAEDTQGFIIITEGEIKAAMAAELGLYVIALGGVTAYSDKKHGHSLLKDFEQIKWKGRKVYILFDSDSATNYNVVSAQFKLARELSNLGAQVYPVCLPALPGFDKTGLDDYLLTMGNDATAVGTLMKEVLGPKAQPWIECVGLQELNNEVVYINKPNIVYCPARDHKMSPNDFVNTHYSTRRYIKVTVTKEDIKRQEAPAAKAWKDWPFRRELEDFTYRPGQPAITDDNKYNLWQPPPFTSAKGDVAQWHRLMEWVFTGATAKERKWFEQWCAYPLQHLGAKLKTAVVLWGAQGSGKSLTAESIMRLYGWVDKDEDMRSQPNATKFGNEQLMGRFNSWAESKQLVVGEEIVASAGDKRIVSEKLKTLITDTTITIEQKFVNPYTLPNRMNMIILSNHPTALKLEDTDRRYFIHHIRGNTIPPEIYEPYDKWIRSTEGIGALLYYFEHLSLDGFNPMAPALITEAKRDMITDGRSEHSAWVYNLHNDPDNTLAGIGGALSSYCLYTADELLELYRLKYEKTNVTAQTLAAEMRQQQLPKAYSGVVRTSKGSKNLWLIRPIPEDLKGRPSDIGRFYDDERAGAKKAKFEKKP